MKTVQYEINNEEYLDAVVLCSSLNEPKKCLLYVLGTEETCNILALAETDDGKSYTASQEDYMNEPNLIQLQKSLKDLSQQNNKEFQTYLKLKKKYGDS